MTGMYNVLEKLRCGDPLTESERDVHTLAACGVLRELHDELDAAVAEAYGWTWPEPTAVVLERLVALHDARAEEERRGVVRWLRPAFQAPRFGGQVDAAGPELTLAAAAAAPATRPAWPATVIEQIAALQAAAAAGPVSVEEAAARFAGARRELVARHLDTLAIMGELQEMPDGRYAALLVAV